MRASIFSTSTELVRQASGEFVLQRLRADSRPVVLLLSGGSALGSYVPLSDYLKSGYRRSLATRLAVGQVDERFGPMGHADSNAAAMAERSQIFDVCQSHGVAHRQMLEEGQSLAKAADAYDSWLRDIFKTHPRRIAVMGVGQDGHTAGILPMSQTKFDRTFTTGRLVVGYDSPDSFRQRITITPQAITLLDEVVVIAFNQKRGVLTRSLLAEQAPAVYEMPAALLRQVPQVHIFTDLKL